MSDTQDTHAVLSAKKDRLEDRRRKTPNAAVVALADMQKLPHPILNIVTAGEELTVIGQVLYEETYDPVGTALHHARAGVDAIAFFSDSQVYTHGLDDLLLLSRGIKLPVIYQNFVLDEYHVAEARAAGAAALTLYASVVPPEALRSIVSVTQRWRMTAILQIENEDHFQFVELLSPHVVCVGNPYERNTLQDIKTLSNIRHKIPNYVQVMLLGCLNTTEELELALDLEVDAVTLGRQLIDSPEVMQKLLKQRS